MGVEGMLNSGKSGGGPPHAKAVCDDCGCEEEVACAYARSRNPDQRQPNEGQVRTKVTAMGWSYVKGKLRCSDCEEKRKTMATKNKEPQVVEPKRDMTTREKIGIYAMLADVYDLDAGHYIGGETDDSVADVLGVMPGWVAQIREADFGPDGANDDIAILSERVETMERELARNRDVLVNLTKTQSGMSDEVASMATELKRIKDTLSRRVRKTAGIS